MAFFPFFGRRKPASGRKRLPIEHERSKLRSEQAEIEMMRLKIEQEKDALQRRMEAIAIGKEKRRLEEEVMMRRKAQAAAERIRNPQPGNKLHVATVNSGRRTKPEQRAARNQLLILCAILCGLLFLLWKSIH